MTCTCNHISVYKKMGRTDPTNTFTLRRMFEMALIRRFKKLSQLITKVIVEDDVFGLTNSPMVQASPGRQAFNFTRSGDRVAAFMQWLNQQVLDGVLEIGNMSQIGSGVEGAWTNMYVTDSYKRGVQRARYEMNKAGFNVPKIGDGGGINAAMNAPFHIDRCFISPALPIYTIKGWVKIKDIQVGDLVLTHKGRFKEVTELHRTPKQLPNVVTIETGKFQRSITATVGHPLLVNGKWTVIDNIKVGDTISYLASRCKYCKKLIPYKNQYCDVNCARLGTQKSRSEKAKLNWQNKEYKEKTINGMKMIFTDGKKNRFESTKKANEKVKQMRSEGVLFGFEKLNVNQKDELQRKAYEGKKSKILNGNFGFQNKNIRDKAIEKGKKITLELIKKGEHPFTKSDVREKAINNAKISVKKLSLIGEWGTQRSEIMEKVITGIAKYRRNSREKFKRRGAGQTGIEKKIQLILDDIGIDYISEYNIGRYIVDFAIPSLNLAIEADGKYWHKNTEKDRIRQKQIEKKGWQMVRFGEDEINNNLNLVEQSLIRLTCNHSNLYEFIDLPVTKVICKKVKSPRMLYNLSVKDDESYIANGFVVHNCGLLYTRVFNELKGITDTMSIQMNKVLAQGMIDGDGPRMLARKMNAVIKGGGADLSMTDTLGRFIPAERRARMLAQTEMIRAHHIATVQEYKNWGTVGVKVQAEWSTSGDGRVCEQCSSLEGKIYTIDEIENLIPRHPNCRCLALPTMPEKEVKEQKN